MKLVSGYFAVAFIVLWSISITGCDDCDDCGPLLREPTVKVKFFNTDSLENTESALDDLNMEIESFNSTLETLNQTLENVSDSLQMVDALILNGEELSSLRDELIDMQDSVQLAFDETLQSRVDAEEELNELNQVKRTIEDGKIQIDSIVSVNDNKSISFGTDSLEVFKFPLSVNQDSTSYQIFIGEINYSLSLEYIRNFSEDERSRIEIIISNIKIKEGHTFEKIDISCEVCASNETSITAYF